ncbi:MAG: hypothetical protein E7200_04855 [Selenomonas ruminantium]|nr:hypothetical protein [Selenomonas ruminantium]
MREQIIVFGRGAYWKVKKEELCKLYEVVAYLDNNALNGELEDGMPVILPGDVKHFPGKKIVIMASKKYFMEMALQLIRLRVEPNKILLGINLLPCFDKGEEFLHSLHGTIDFDGENAVLYCDRGRYSFCDSQGYQSVMRKLMRGNDFFEDIFPRLSVLPMSRNFGTERGPAIDRYYIEKFLEKNSMDITGNVLEIADTAYIRRFGRNVSHMYALHVVNWGGQMDISTGIWKLEMEFQKTILIA